MLGVQRRRWVLWNMWEVGCKDSCRRFLMRSCPWVGRPGAVESHPGQTLTEDRPRCGTRETGNILKVSQSSVEKHLQQLDYINLFDIWVPQQSSMVVGVPSWLNFHMQFSTDMEGKHSISKTKCEGMNRWYLRKMWNRRYWGKSRNHQQPIQRVVFIWRRWCPAVGAPCGNSEGFSRQWLISVRLSESHLRENVQNLSGKTGELQDKAGAHLLLFGDQGKSSSLAGQSWFIRSPHQSLCLCMTL